MGKLLSIFLACVLLLLGTYLWWSGQALPVSDNPRQETQQSVDGSIDLVNDNLATATAASEASQERETINPSSSESDSVLLEVVYARTGEPAIGATVHLLDFQSEAWRSRSEEIRQLPPPERQISSLAERYGSTFVTDARGTIRLPPTKPMAYVSAVLAPTWFGKTHLLSQAGLVRLELDPTMVIQVQVKQIDGGPLRWCRLRLARGNGGAGLGWVEAITDERGLAQVVLPAASAAIDFDYWETFRATVQTPFGELPSEDISLIHDKDAVHLHQVVAGSLVLQAPPDLDPRSQSATVMVERDGSNYRKEDQIREGILRFDNVPLGERFTAHLILEREGKHYLAKAAGPRIPGEVVSLQLEEWIGPPTLMFRVVDESGKPIADTQLNLGQRSASGGHSQRPSTDAEGRAQVMLLQSRFNQPHTLSINVQRGEHWLKFERDLPGNYPPGPTELGDLVMELPALICAGKVLSVEGAPVAGVRIRVEGYVADDKQGKRKMVGVSHTDVSGRFELRSDIMCLNPMLTASRAGWYQPSPVPVHYGQKDLELRLSAAGSLQARVLMGGKVRKGPDFRLRSVDEQVVVKKFQLLKEDGDPEAWSLSMRDLPPGSFWLDAYAEYREQVITSVGPINLIPGEVEELVEIDLRNVLTEYRIAVSSAARLPVVGARVRIVREGSAQYESLKTDVNGMAYFLHWGERTDMVIDNELGYAAKFEVEDHVHVQLRFNEQRISIADDLSFLGSEFQISLRFGPPEDRLWGVSRWEGVEVSFDASVARRTAALRAQGNLTVDWVISRKDGSEKTSIGRSSERISGTRGAGARLRVPELVMQGMREWAKEQR